MCLSELITSSPGSILTTATCVNSDHGPQLPRFFPCDTAFAFSLRPGTRADPVVNHTGTHWTLGRSLSHYCAKLLFCLPHCQGADHGAEISCGTGGATHWLTMQGDNNAPEQHISNISPLAFLSICTDFSSYCFQYFPFLSASILLPYLGCASRLS